MSSQRLDRYTTKFVNHLNKGKTMCKEKRQCVLCNSEYAAKQPHQKFCSKSCSKSYWRGRHDKAEVRTETRQCVTCGGDFTWRSTACNQKFCGSACYPKPEPRKKWEETRQCARCGEDFTWKSTNRNKKYCSSTCTTKSQWEKPEKPAIVDKPEEYPVSHIEDKYYVYGWYDGDLLFYVGKGIGDRRRRRHKLSDGADAYCEDVKRRSKDFRCVFLSTGLTERESRLVESALIKTNKPFTNVQPKSI